MAAIEHAELIELADKLAAVIALVSQPGHDDFSPVAWHPLVLLLLDKMLEQGPLEVSWSKASYMGAYQIACQMSVGGACTSARVESSCRAVATSSLLAMSMRRGHPDG
ncbi:MAG: hypothetical protein R3B72_50135 [Polyangiaceae bacterium]